MKTYLTIIISAALLMTWSCASTTNTEDAQPDDSSADKGTGKDKKTDSDSPADLDSSGGTATEPDESEPDTGPEKGDDSDSHAVPEGTDSTIENASDSADTMESENASDAPNEVETENGSELDSNDDTESEKEASTDSISDTESSAADGTDSEKAQDSDTTDSVEKLLTPEDLFGHWMSVGAVGNCYFIENWFTFEPPDTVIYQIIDDNNCYGVAVGLQYEGTFRIENERDLVLTWSEMAGYTTAHPDDLDVFEEQYPAAIAPSSKGVPTLLTSVLTRVDDTHWHVTDRQEGMRDGETVFLDKISLDAELDGPIPDSGTGALVTALSIVVSQVETGWSDTYAADVFAVPCVYELGSDEWMRVIFEGYQEDTGGSQKWEAFLDAEGAPDAHPPWAWERMDSEVIVNYGLYLNDPTFMTRSGTGRFEKQDTPPPAPEMR